MAHLGPHESARPGRSPQLSLMRQHPRATGAGPISVHSDGEQRGLRSVHAPAGCRDPTPDSPCTFQSSRSSLGGRKPRPGGASCGGPRRQVRSHSASDACMTPQPRKRPSQRSCRDTRARADADQREPRRRRHVTVVNTSGWPRSATVGRRAQRSMVSRSDVCEVVRDGCQAKIRLLRPSLDQAPEE